MVEKLKNKILFLLLASLLFLFFSGSALATISSFYPTSGIDKSGYPQEPSYTLSYYDLTKLSASDNQRYGSRYIWNLPDYNDNRYIEFVFSPNLPIGTLIHNANLYFEWQRSSSYVQAARIRVWDQSASTWRIFSFSVPSVGYDKMEVIDLSPYINTLEDVNNFKLQFQARDSSCYNGGYTFHDLVELKLNYTLPECYTDEDCDDNNECTSEVCQDYRCIRTNLPASTPCEKDGLFCTVDHCDGQGNCVYLEPYDCVDVIDCTIDYCDEENDRCVHQPDDSYCDDGLWCNGFETCSVLAGCKPGIPVDCSENNIPGIATCTYDPDGNPFTWDFRNPFTSNCVELGNNQGYCTIGISTITHTCADDDLEDTVPLGGCGAECDENKDCLCPEDECVGSDFYDYPDFGLCLSDCTCDVRTDDCNPCHPTIHLNDPRCYYCGDGEVNPGEECELPGTSNNEYCSQTTTTCDGHKLGTRDEFGNCDAACGCVYDSFTFACVKDQCGAECSSDADCGEDGWYAISEWNYSHNNCSRCRMEEYRDYYCSEDCMCGYAVIETREYCEPVNEGEVCKVSPYDCKDACTKGQREYVCSQGACVFNRWINLEACNPYLCDINCGNAFCSQVCSFACGAQCEKDSDCQSYCQGNIRYYSGDCLSNCSCSYQTQDCSELSGWNATEETRWVDVDVCTEKEQRKEVYLDYSCVANGEASCVYEITDTRWVDTGNTREKEDEVGPEVRKISVNPDPTSCNLKTYGNASLWDCHVIAYAEYFINQEPVCPEPGTGKPMQALDGAFDENEEDVWAEIEKPCASGVYNFWVRAKDEFGNWGDCISYTFVLGNVPPTVYDVRVEGRNVYATIDSNVMLLKIIGAEFFIDRNTPVGGGFVMNASDGNFDESREDVVGTIPEDVWNRLSLGQHTVYVHGRDAAMNWGNFGTATFTKTTGGSSEGGSGSSGGSSSSSSSSSGGGMILPLATPTTTLPATPTTLPSTQSSGASSSSSESLTTTPQESEEVAELTEESSEQETNKINFMGMFAAFEGATNYIFLIVLAILAVISTIARMKVSPGRPE
ncbi:MAG: hypothetical protein QXL86_02655 [Candidatus Aenigmatarchaeota archaeon]